MGEAREIRSSKATLLLALTKQTATWLGTVAGLLKMMASVLPQQGTEFSQQPVRLEVDPEPQKRTTDLADTLTKAGETLSKARSYALPGLPARSAVWSREVRGPLLAAEGQSLLTEGQAGSAWTVGRRGQSREGLLRPLPLALC